jgi:uroporphyrinogen decarboxylase
VNDRFLAACRRQPVDATPVWFMRQAGRSLPEYRRVRERISLQGIVADPALCAEVTMQPVERLGVDAAIVFADITTPLAGIGIDCEIKEGVGPVIGHPIRGAQDVARLRPFDPAASVGSLLEGIGLVRAAARVPVIGFAGAPFTLACYAIDGGPSRTFPETRALMRRQPEVFAALMERLSEMTVAYLTAQVRAGAQAVQLFDSWVGELSPLDYEVAVLPHLSRVFAALAPLDVPVIHFGTGTCGLLERQARAGGDVIGLDHRVALGEAWRRVPDRAVQGNLDPTVLLGPWIEVERATRWVLEEAAGRPGHVFNLGHGVLPPTDPDQLRRVVDLVHDWQPATVGAGAHA